MGNEEIPLRAGSTQFGYDLIRRARRAEIPGFHEPSGPSVGTAKVSDRTGRADGDAKVNLTHEAIPAIGWPSMTMDMALLEGARIRGVKSGDQAWFVFAIGPDGVYAVKEIAPKSGPKPAAPAGAVVTEGVVNAMPRNLDTER